MTAPTITAPPKLNRRDAAEYLGLKPCTLERWACEGKGPKFFKAGSRVWYMQEELDRWIEERTTNNSTDLD